MVTSCSIGSFFGLGGAPEEITSANDDSDLGAFFDLALDFRAKPCNDASVDAEASWGSQGFPAEFDENSTHGRLGRLVSGADLEARERFELVFFASFCEHLGDSFFVVFDERLIS